MFIITQGLGGGTLVTAGYGSGEEPQSDEVCLGFRCDVDEEEECIKWKFVRGAYIAVVTVCDLKAKHRKTF